MYIFTRYSYCRCSSGGGSGSSPSGGRGSIHLLKVSPCSSTSVSRFKLRKHCCAYSVIRISCRNKSRYLKQSFGTTQFIRWAGRCNYSRAPGKRASNTQSRFALVGLIITGTEHICALHHVPTYEHASGYAYVCDCV